MLVAVIGLLIGLLTLIVIGIIVFFVRRKRRRSVSLHSPNDRPRTSTEFFQNSVYSLRLENRTSNVIYEKIQDRTQADGPSLPSLPSQLVQKLDEVGGDRNVSMTAAVRYVPMPPRGNHGEQEQPPL